MDFETLLLHTGDEYDKTTGALSKPIYQVSTFEQKDVTQKQDYYYSRSENPTRKGLETALAKIENGKYGYAFSSGMAAISGVAFALLKNGDHIIAPIDIYGGSHRLFNRILPEFGITTTFVDMTNLNNIQAAIKPNTKLLYLETPSNPLLKVVDIKSCVNIAKENNLITAIDNTFMTPVFQKPLDLGIDVVIHSATKYLGGHSDVVAGAVITNDFSLAKKIYFIQYSLGSILGPQDSFLLLRGIKTLKLRIDKQAETTYKLARWLKEQKWIKNVYYPGFEGTKDYEIQKQQASGFGCVVSIDCQDEQTAYKIMKNVKIWSVAVSLGGVESIITYPRLMSHNDVPEEDALKMGITRSLLRLSIGIESFDDLSNDLLQAIDN
ncbi:MAG TPA: PLP-dependent aspartate aminotransferase family protein [Ignavibacteriales bacterium]|nr:PLP-dependent aspartate aminotransferase family protein [Ignavibacteriales bacterium]HOL80337.1 PLP-dependent aspartate aminotransferase family protein [Ignavibacteriales bacterium]HOM64616.1 PLP-dependent aspartate aminotransferase family protein [Ignavibacteriales bacterium]HPD68196.1 PLP-dependent aspartate aminotransferase family protein [Ignavibacteriales bacterium]HPP32526.1 PLP-dependent aspartate aminotransferase family protein [Ignavibacteriales bacterium]